jgi:hypothetical protein
MFGPKQMKRENTVASRLARFGGLDQIDCPCGGSHRNDRQTVPFVGSSDWFLEWVSPFLVMVAAYKTRQKITESIEIRRIRGAGEK